jgi:LuxR family maltose regulon positive regulatory protein
MTVAKAASVKAQADVYAHKLFAPVAYAGAIRRDAILDRVLANESARVVLLQGPAGHGKSTVLQQLKSIFEERGHLTPWMTLDEADNDIRRFHLHAQAMVATLGSGVEERESGRRRSDWLIGRLLKSGKPVALFLDDFQVLTNKTVLTFFRELFERVPEHTRLFIGTRSMPEIGLSRLVVNQRALILHADHLRFSPAEVEQFFSSSMKDISRDEIAAIYRRTEGWPAALQLFRLSLPSPQVRKSLVDVADYRPRELAEYLADNVLALQQPEIQDFLLRTSLLGRLSASLCQAVTGCADAQDLLMKLERTGLFVRSLDSDLRWFQYHALFASFLVEQLEGQAPETVREVHRKAARWHLERELYEETVHHAIACRDFTLAADTLDHWASQLVPDAQIITMERWYEQLPFEEVAKRPSLLIKSAWALVFLHRRQKLKPLLKLLEERAAAGDPDANVVLSMAAISVDDVAGSFAWVKRVPLQERKPETFAAFELGAAANLYAYHSLGAGDFEKARSLLALARGHNERGSAIFSGGYTVGMHGMHLLAQGQLQEALDSFRAGMGESRMHVDKSVASAALVACYIWALYEANELDQAEALFGRHHDIISESALLDFMAVAYLAMVRIHDARGRAGQALEVLDEAESIGHGHGWERLIRLINWERARRALLSGSLDRAVAIAALNDAPSRAPEQILFSEDAEGESLGHIRLAIHRMDFARAADALAAEFSRSRGRIYRQIKLNLLNAQLHQRRDEPNGAHRCLKKALQLAAPGGFVRCFLDEGEGILQLLRDEYQRLMEKEEGEAAPGVKRSYLEQLLQASGTDLSRTREPHIAQPVEPLTDREKEILAFLANGVSNREMASRLFVSENTVKFHLKNIYSKLAVGSRLQAITAARQLGLIH